MSISLVSSLWYLKCTWRLIHSFLSRMKSLSPVDRKSSASSRCRVAVSAWSSALSNSSCRPRMVFFVSSPSSSPMRCLLFRGHHRRVYFTVIDDTKLTAWQVVCAKSAGCLSERVLQSVDGPESRSAKRRSRAFGLNLMAVRSEIVVLKRCSPYYQTHSRSVAEKPGTGRGSVPGIKRQIRKQAANRAQHCEQGADMCRDDRLRVVAIPHEADPRRHEREIGDGGGHQQLEEGL